MRVIVSTVKLTNYQNREKAVILSADDKFYCLHHQSTLHGFMQIADATTKQLVNGANFGKMTENSKFFEVVEAVTKKGNKYFAAI